ncbi:MAG TPA: RDD family protein, partial [Candidatus Baltobacteraceae bacterium]
MDRTISVRTPESIAFSYELAGLGSRFLALAFDMFVQLVVLVGIMWGLAYAGAHMVSVTKHPAIGDRTAQSIGYAIVIAILFIVFFGYFIAFEAFWNGQTPGKKLLGIRVARDGGYALDLGAAFIRNLIRIGELAL